MGFDRVFNFLMDSDPVHSNTDSSWGKEVIVYDDSDEVWVCFLGWRTSIGVAKRLNLLPKKGRVIVYHEPNSLVANDPHLATKRFFEIYRDAKQYIKSSVNVFSVSLGNAHGFYFASRHNSKVKKFISLLPGPELGRNIWKSCAAEGIKHRAELLGFTQQSYDDFINKFNPLSTYKNLPQSSCFYFALYDDYIPSEDQVEMSELLKNVGHKDIRFFRCGHIFGHIWFGLLNTFNRIPW
jgi:pimeloyl-ACP methyl ester carboxylesterase